jgi:hypothetical protein
LNNRWITVKSKVSWRKLSEGMRLRRFCALTGRLSSAAPCSRRTSGYLFRGEYIYYSQGARLTRRTSGYLFMHLCTCLCMDVLMYLFFIYVLMYLLLLISVLGGHMKLLFTWYIIIVIIHTLGGPSVCRLSLFNFVSSFKF